MACQAHEFGSTFTPTIRHEIVDERILCLLFTWMNKGVTRLGIYCKVRIISYSAGAVYDCKVTMKTVVDLATRQVIAWRIRYVTLASRISLE